MLRIVPTGVVNGINTSYTLSQTSVAGAPTLVVLNGQLLGQVLTAPTTTQCILTGATLTMGLAPVTADDFQVFIQTNLRDGLIESAMTGVQDSSNLTYTLAAAPPASSHVMLYRNGLLLMQVTSAPTAQQFTISGTTLVLGAAPTSTEFLIAYIQDANSLAFFRALDMQGLATRWATALSAPTPFDPLLIVFVNGQLQQEVMAPPIATQYYRQVAVGGVLTLTLGISLIAADDLQVYVVGLRTRMTLAPSLPLFLDMQNELLVLMNEQIDLEEAKMCLNRRWQKILNAWSWSFVKTSSVLTTKAPKSAGTLSVTQDSVLIVGTNTSFAATDIGAYLLLGAQPYLVVDVQVMSATQQIVLVNSPYPGTTNTALAYQMYYKDYALDPDVVDIVSMVGPNWAFDEITGRALDDADANRAFVGQPSSYVRMGMVDGVYHIELWPVPDARYTIHYSALVRSALTLKGQIIPDIAEVLLMAAEEMATSIVASKRAAEKDYEGAAYWNQRGLLRHASYLESLTELKSKDRRRFGQTNHRAGLSAFVGVPGYDVGA